MICTTRGCKEEIKPSAYLETYGYCPACRTLTKIENRKEPMKPQQIEEVTEPPKATEHEDAEYVYTDCDYHPKYTGRRTPRTDCAICWQVYQHVSKERIAKEK